MKRPRIQSVTEALRLPLCQLFVVVSAAFLLGCNRGPALHDSNAFQSASPELKTMWATAYAAAKTNGYVLAYSTLQNLRNQTNLDAQQIQAVDELIGVVGTRMFDAANKGNPEAVKALQEVQTTTRRR